MFRSSEISLIANRLFVRIVSLSLSTFSWVLGCSYRASSVRTAIRLPTDATVYFVLYLFPLFTLHVSRSHKPVIRGISSCFLYTTIWFLCWTRGNNIIVIVTI